MVDDDEDDEKVIPRTASGGRGQKVTSTVRNDDLVKI